MTYLTQRILQKPILRSQFLRLALISLVLIALQAAPASAQWTTPDASNNIHNTNTGGNVGIGTASPTGTLEVQGAGQNNTLRVISTNPVSGGLYFQNTQTTGQAVTYLDNNRGSFASYGGLLYGSSANALGNLLGVSRADRLFVFADGASNLGMAVGTLGAQPLILGTNNAEKMRIDASGNVGIGINAPSTKLHVVGDGKFTGALSVGGNSQGRTSVMSLGGFSTGDAGTAIDFSGAGTGTLYFSTYKTGIGYGNIALQPEGGNVGIGTPSPSASYKLDVNGDTHVTGSINVTGNINAKFQDVAEWVESSQVVPAGTVVVLDHTKSNQVVASSQAYDTRVAGVISERPGIALGESGDSKVLVATTGRVRVKVDATHSPIHVGDLLVTSDVPGRAMKSEPVNIGGVQLHRPGTLIGKALEPLEKGSGTMLVLLSLQ